MKQPKRQRSESIHSARRDKNVRIGRTRVGKGVFAGRSYNPGAIVGEIEGTIITEPGYGSDYCMNLEDGRVLEPAAPFRYVNHSCDPNCIFDYFDIAESDETLARRVFLMAVERIRPGEELTIDYRWAAGAAIECRCGAANCRGWIVAHEQLPQVLASRKR